VRVVKPTGEREVPRGVLGGAEISQATAGASNIYMGVFRVPPGARSRPHYHANCESAVYILSGTLEVRWGDHLEQVVRLEPRDLVYVPPRETHVLENLSDTEPAEYVVARDAPQEDSVEVPWAQVQTDAP
jgi:uncharacterized RmlC-like cupin family protein